MFLINKKLNQTSKRVLSLIVFSCLLLIQVKADFIFQDFEAKSTSFTPGKVNTMLFSVDFETNNGAFADYIIFEFPTGWTVSPNPNQPNVLSTACGDLVISGNNTSKLIFGKDNPSGVPVGNSNCGVIGSGTNQFYLDVFVPSGVSDDQQVYATIIGDGYGNLDYKIETLSLSLAVVACELTCPDDIVVNADPGVCSAYVTIPLPTTTGNTCDPAPVDMSGDYEVGEHEVVFTSGGATCSMMVTVVDSEAPVFGNCNDIVSNLDPGECGMVMYYDLGIEEPCEAQDVFVTQSTNPSIITTSVACPGGQNSNIRVFDLDAMGYYTDINVTNIEIGVFQAFNNPLVEVNIYELVGALSFDEMNLVAETSEILPNLFFQTYTIPISATLDVSKDYVVEIVTPPSLISGFVMGGNLFGQSGTSYIYSDFCNLNEIQDVSNTGYPAHWIINLIGVQNAYKLTQTEGLESGDYFPIGVTTNSFVVTDASGNENTCSFEMDLVGFTPTSTTLACNDKVNVSLDENCEGLITADMVLEGNDYACYQNYEVVIKDSYGNEYGDMITSDLIEKDLIVEVTDENDNTCWGKIIIEDKLGPMLQCSTRVTQCTQESYPGAPLSDLMRFTVEPDSIISAGNPSVVDIPIEIKGLEDAIITDVNIELNFEHSYVSDIAVVLISPEGTEVTTLIQPGIFCGGNDLDVKLDDEAVLLYDDLNNSCDPSSTPSIKGLFRPYENLSLFDDEDPNGTWIVSVRDFGFGDGGKVNKITIEIEQEGGIVGLPIPKDATYTDYGPNTFLVVGLDACGPTILKYKDKSVKMDCNSDYTKIIYRTYTAEDQSGNVAMECTDTILVYRTDLGTLQFPPNLDGKALPVLPCTSPYPDPSISGEPTGDFCDNVKITYEDLVIDICEGSYKVLRTGLVLDPCSSDIVEHTQIIKVIDDIGPSITCPVIYKPISTEVNSCTGGLYLPPPTITDNCSSNPTYTVKTTSGVLIDQGSGYYLDDLPQGVHTVTYTATDDCGNTSSCDFDIEIVDNIPPVAVCDEHTVVALSFEPQAEVLAFTFDDGSYDDCSSITWEVRRMNDNCNYPGNTEFSESVVFCCEDIGTPQMVEMRVTDANGNSNTCMVEVEVADKLAPAISLPPNITLECNEPYDDPDLTGGYAQAYDNCDVELSYQDEVIPSDCGEATIFRNWIAIDASGNVSSQAQIITLVNNDPFELGDITWPKDAVFTDCIGETDPDVTGRPVLQNNVCSEVSVTYEDDVFTAVDGACFQVLRTWTVIDDCQYNPNKPKYGIGWWKDIQIIHIKNTNAPEFDDDCEDRVVEVFGQCEGDVQLTVHATDDCTPDEDIVYTWKIDEYNTYDGIYEYEGVGSTINLVMQHGDHRVLWTASDQCGNVSKCEYVFTVKDGKAPTPYCLSALSTAIMDVNCMVEIWATDYDLGATDNCTPADELIFSFEKDDYVPSMQFTCDQIANGVGQVFDLEVWVTDLAGNQDFCSVQILVEDNEANCCDDSGSVTYSGNIQNMDGVAMQKVDVQIDNPVTGKESLLTDLDGKFSFGMYPGQDYQVTAYKDTDILNGITTLDIVLIQKHILAISKLDDPYKVIAADANNDTKITGTDIVQIRKLILGLNDKFTNGQTSWRFVDSEQVFPDPNKPFPFDEMIVANANLSSNGQFYGVKIGDVNETATPNQVNSGIVTRNANQIQLYYPEISFEKNDIVELPISAEAFNSMIGIQTTFTFDEQLFEFEGIVEGALKEDGIDVNNTQTSKGLLAFLWTEVDPLTTDDVLMTLQFKAKKAGSSKGVLSTSNEITNTIAYNDKYEEFTIELHSQSSTNVEDELNQLIVVKNAPNPFRDETVIQLSLPQNDEVVFTIYNNTGQQVLYSKERYPAGASMLVVQQSLLGTPGVYYYNIQTSYGSYEGKMILIQ